MGHSADPAALYERMEFGPPPDDRPYLIFNLAASLNGRTTLGPGGSSEGIGSALDRAVMRRLETAAGSVLIGAETLRSNPGLWYPREVRRAVVTRTGNLPLGGRFFTDADQPAVVFAPVPLRHLEPIAKVVVLPASTPGVALFDLLAELRHRFGVDTLLCEGGPTLFTALLQLGAVDEVFLTLTPRLIFSPGPGVLTGDSADAPAARLHLLSSQQAGDEVFLRYRVAR
jgi:riboflavin biosynthesis pyrimidine reductase